MIFAPTNNPLSTRNTKARSDAIFRVGMTNICFQAPSGVVIPQADGGVVGCGENVLGIGRKLDMLANGIMSFRKSF